MAIEQSTVPANNNHGKRSEFQNVKYQYLAVIIGNFTAFDAPNARYIEPYFDILIPKKLHSRINDDHSI